MNKKVMILPCSGIGKPTGEIGRQTAYQVAYKLKPEQAGIVCLGRLMIDDQEAIAAIRGSYVITLDGCPDDCARKNVERTGKKVDYAVHTADLLIEYPDLIPSGILNLGDSGKRLVDLLANQIARQVDCLMEGGNGNGSEY